MLIFYYFYSQKLFFCGTKLCGTAEFKLIIVFCYYFILAAFGLSAYTASSTYRDELREELAAYFACESAGGKECDRSGYQQITVLQQFLFVTSHLLLGILPLATLVYIINITNIREARFKHNTRRNSFPTSKTLSTSRDLEMF